MLQAVNRTPFRNRLSRGRIASRATVLGSHLLQTISTTQRADETTLAHVAPLTSTQPSGASGGWTPAAAMAVLGSSMLLAHAGGAEAAAVPMAQIAEIDAGTAKLASDILR